MTHPPALGKLLGPRGACGYAHSLRFTSPPLARWASQTGQLRPCSKGGVRKGRYWVSPPIAFETPAVWTATAGVGALLPAPAPRPLPRERCEVRPEAGERCGVHPERRG